MLTDSGSNPEFSSRCDYDNRNDFFRDNNSGANGNISTSFYWCAFCFVCRLYNMCHSGICCKNHKEKQKTMI